MATMPLLTPSESIKFESALLNYSNGIAAPEWAMYTDRGSDDFNERHLPPPRDDQLAKATKDLISLDTSSLRWHESTDRDLMSASLPATSPQSSSFKPTPSSSYPAPGHHARLSSPIHQFFSIPSPSVQRLPLTIAPSRTLDSSAASDSQRSLSSVSSDPTPSPPTPPALKRPFTSSSDLSSQAGPSSGSNTSGSSSRQQSKKPRASPPHQGPVLNAKPTLLTPSQKKANHIQSEQKRRANIRRGYEALCETVPALREAIAAEERELAEGTAETENGSRGKPKKKNRAKRGLCESGEKVDGRAGPRSENVVLQKTIDYIHELLSERGALLERLNRARCKFPPGHPALTPLQGVALWEREWTGGTGNLEDDSSDEEDES